MKHVKRILLAVVAIIALLVACKKDNPFKDVKLVFDEENFEISEGGALYLARYLSIYPESADTLTISWSSDNQDVAVVDDEGVVSGVKDGVATITASTHGISSSCKVTVKEIKIENFSIPYEIETVINTKTAIKTTVVPADASKTRIQWSTTNEDIKPIFDIEAGEWIINTSYPGNATLTATYGDLPSRSCKVKVTEKPIYHIVNFTLKEKDYQTIIPIGKSVTIIATDINPNNATAADIVLSTDKPDAVTISNPVFDASENTATWTVTAGNTPCSSLTLTAVAGDRDCTKTLNFAIAKVNVNKVIMPKTAIVMENKKQANLGTVDKLIIEPKSASVQDVQFTIRNYNNVKIQSDVMEIKKENGCYVLYAKAAGSGRYSVIATVDGINSEPMYVNIVSKESVAAKIRGYKKTEGGVVVAEYYGTIGMREKISPANIIEGYSKMDKAYQDAFSLEFVSMNKTNEKSFYPLKNYKAGDVAPTTYNAFQYDYGFTSNTSTRLRGNLNYVLHLKTENEPIDITISATLYTSYVKMWRERFDINNNKTTSDLNYENDCMYIGPKWSNGVEYHDAVNIYVRYYTSQTGTATADYKFYWRDLAKPRWVQTVNACPMAGNRDDTNVPAADRDIHITVTFGASQDGSCQYEPHPY